ncbi:hypothetical protein SCLARK_001007 [Spiroplasma clarkii]|uniref:Uncharacterized protein n=1 Tax=Spiroplasma clarkii TaxID=2139 RepID=A0A1Y0L1I9_9MOLU|nr:hypothetical protein [Spiroplasma clarkii]ARU91598.1 hypothetical protein SCLARK_001007 [Spiroplasma clarkii]ATX70997.1 hypothetical protein SCLAR_v1c06800 [Spiroplasma clarkii]
MKTGNNLKEFLDIVSIKWFKENFDDKLTDLKKSILEIPNENADAMAMQIFDVQTLNSYVSEIKANVDSLENYSEIVIFMNKYTLNHKKFQDIFTNKELAKTVENFQQNKDKLTEILLQSHISNSLVMFQNALSANLDLTNKLGADSSLTEIDIEDLEYILIKLLENQIFELNEWSSRFPKFSNKLSQELKNLNESKSILEVADISHTIEHVFMNTISEFLNDTENTQTISSSAEEIVEVNKGVEISEFILIKSSFCAEIYNKFKEK